MKNTLKFSIFLTFMITIFSLNQLGWASQDKLLDEHIDPVSQYNLGLKYYLGEAIPRDDIQADYWFEKAAEQGHAMGQWRMGVKCFEGRNGPKDLIQAFNWFQKAEVQDCLAARHDLGKMYFYGNGVDEDVTKGLQLITDSAQKDNYDAQMTLMLIYKEGQKGIPQDLDKAGEWKKKVLGNLYFSQAKNKYQKINTVRNLEVPVILEEALFLFHKAAEQGHEEARALMMRLTNRNDIRFPENQ
ncbi:MAG: tetratricopeptide repeat protein [Janthinobacterium lividum]